MFVPLDAEDMVGGAKPRPLRAGLLATGHHIDSYGNSTRYAQMLENRSPAGTFGRQMSSYRLPRVIDNHSRLLYKAPRSHFSRGDHNRFTTLNSGKNELRDKGAGKRDGMQSPQPAPSIVET